MDNEIEAKLKAEAAKLEAEAEAKAKDTYEKARAFYENDLPGLEKKAVEKAKEYEEEAIVKVRGLWETHPWVLIVIGILLLMVVFYFIADAMASRRYEQRMNEATKAVEVFKQEAEKAKAEANTAKTAAQAAEAKLPELNQRLAELDARASALVVATQQVRSSYEKSKAGNSNSFVFTSDRLADIRRLCSDLEAVGHTCKPSGL